MPRGKAKQDVETLEMALIGFEQKKIEIDEKISHIKSLLGTGTASKAAASPKMPKAVTSGRQKRTLSPAARKRIALAQKKRWAEHRKAQSEAAK